MICTHVATFFFSAARRPGVERQRAGDFYTVKISEAKRSGPISMLENRPAESFVRRRSSLYAIASSFTISQSLDTLATQTFAKKSGCSPGAHQTSERLLANGAVLAKSSTIRANSADGAVFFSFFCTPGSAPPCPTTPEKAKSAEFRQAAEDQHRQAAARLRHRQCAVMHGLSPDRGHLSRAWCGSSP